GQVAHFDSFSRIPPERFALALNTHLPPDIRLVGSAACTTAFHARYTARGKTYRYQIHNSVYPSALYRNQRAHVIPPLDVQAMRDAARLVIGEHDFRAFAASGGEAKKTIRDIREVCLDRSGDLIEITVTGRSFLYNMVRILAGTLISIGVKKIPADAFLTAFRTGSRLDLGVTAPAHGLTLMAVYYDGDSL
ncbi:MAG: tRNA pseudouridine synthase A, partial [Clostridia bacterium]|nr:tRNA pseudouridine synthase A [Clostridia bacterium]